MKKLVLAAGIALIATTAQQASAQLALQNFNSGIPSTWPMINVDGKNVATQFNANIVAALSGASGKAWMTVSRATNDSAAFTTSYFTPAGQADRWLLTPSFTVNNANTFLSWDDLAADASYPDSMQILVSPTAGTTTAAFTTTIYNQSGTAGVWGTHVVSLGAYNGQTIRLAFRDHSTDEFALLLDNVQTVVLPNVDASVIAVTPAASDPGAFVTPSTPVTIGGTVKNLGAQPLTGYVVKYKQGSNAAVSTTVSANIATYATGTFSITTPFTPASVAAYPISVWVEATGDANHANDTATTTVTGIAFTPTKRLLLEENTSSSCGWCPRGMVFMDSIFKMHPNVTPVAIHGIIDWTDPMRVAAYDGLIGGLTGGGMPNVLVDRRLTVDPSDLFSTYSAQSGSFGFADLTFGSVTNANGSVTVPVTVKPAADLNGNYSVALTITEDDVTGSGTNVTLGTNPCTGSGSVTYDVWGQLNYYAGGGSGQLHNSEYDFATLPCYIPANQMHYNFVARTSTTTSTAALPTTMAASSTYNVTLTGVTTAVNHATKARIVIMLIDNATGRVLNSNYKDFGNTASVGTIGTGISAFSVFPNPATNVSNAKVTLDAKSSVSLKVIDAMGRVVYETASETMQAGEHQLSIPTSQFASGLYNVRLTTDKGAATERLSVTK